MRLRHFSRSQSLFGLRCDNLFYLVAMPVGANIRGVNAVKVKTARLENNLPS